MKFKTILFLTLASAVRGRVYFDINLAHPALDTSLYEDVLDADLCDEQIRFITSNPTLQIQFADAGIRTPRGLAMGNFVDMGNYHQCMGIVHDTEDMSIQGKYCNILVPLNQDLEFPLNSRWAGLGSSSLHVDEDVISKVEEYNLRRSQILASMGVIDEHMKRSALVPDLGVTLRLAVCVPKPCSTEQAITSLFFNVSDIGFQYQDDFCRLPNDKPWSPADTAAVAVFSTIGVLTLLCTTYDLVYTLLLERDPKESHRLYTSFSVYTNGRRLMNFNSAPGTLHCLDGIRTWAMAWVVVGHAFATELFLANPIEALGVWTRSLSSIWILAAPITVDTFFCLGGILLVYTTVGKMNGVQLIKNLPLFYLNRLLRLFPLLAAAVLLQASYFNRMSDGPHWAVVESQTNNCRNNWWVTFLHVQNFVGVSTMCLPHTWYIAIDVQLYIISPIILFWVLGSSRKIAWMALVGGLMASLTAASIYNFISNFPSGPMAVNRELSDLADYNLYYYLNTLTRASPFFVGMLFGYVLHVFRGKKLRMPWISVTILWACAASVSTTIFFYPYFIMQMSWDYQIVDNIMNSFMRPAWSAALCWMVFACTHGYGGPVNWFLTLDIWKLPARISYAIYIFHYPLMFSVNGSALTPVYFSVPGYTFKFLAHMSLSLVVAYFATLLIDAPFSTLSKMLLEGSRKKAVRPVIENKKPDCQEIESEKQGEDINITNNINVENNISKNKTTDLVSENSPKNVNDIKVPPNNEMNDDNDILNTGSNSNKHNNILIKSSENEENILNAIDVVFEPMHRHNSNDNSRTDK